MRRSVTAVMSGVSLVVVGLSLRASWQPAHHVASAARAGVVVVPSTTPSVAPSSPEPSPTATHRAHASRSPVVRATTSPAAKSVTVNGDAVDTRYGPVQVQIVVRGGKIMRAEAVAYPTGEQRDREINGQAIPMLDQEVLDAQSAQIDTVSGATYTSEGYIGSLQSAVDAAHNAGAL